mmetsp:Transcript_26665/g.106824  ORF Transcript_26665/g.106824 Transcript_26665/m.106824 type:complete len:272 (+) Transcript_26665:39-854(+)
MVTAPTAPADATTKSPLVEAADDGAQPDEAPEAELVATQPIAAHAVDDALLPVVSEARAVDAGDAAPVVAGEVVSVVPVVAALGPTAMPAFQGAVVARDAQAWPFAMTCASLTHCADDAGLCCYACLCLECAAAEVSAKIGNRGWCGTESCAAQWCAAYLTAAAVSTLGLCVVGLGAVLAPCVWTVWLAQIRNAQKAVYRLPHDELCCDATVTSTLPWYFLCLDCACCAVYQQAFYLKHVAKKDLECCCYQCCCASCHPIDLHETTASLLT